MQDYTAEQLGDIRVEEINNKTRGRFSIVVVQPRSNDQVLVLEPAMWDAAEEKVKQMILAGVDESDIRFTHRTSDELTTDGLPLRPVREGLFWTLRDQAQLEEGATK